MSERSVSPTVYGIETECSYTLTLPDNITPKLKNMCRAVYVQLGLDREPDDMEDYQFRHIREALGLMGIYSNYAGMLTNGGRLYLEPSGLEYDTPETLTAAETVDYYFDGDAIVLGIFEYFCRQGVLKDYQLNRRAVDYTRSSRGIHLNTCTQLKATPATVEQLAALNVVKGAIFGSGGLLVDEDGRMEYHHSPRLSVTDSLEGGSTQHSERPYFITKNDKA
jgi:hypothetical protein